MDVLKEAAIETIKRMPDGCTIEDIMVKLDFIAQVLAGAKDAEVRKLMTTEELLNKVAQRASLAFSEGALSFAKESARVSS